MIIEPDTPPICCECGRICRLPSGEWDDLYFVRGGDPLCNACYVADQMEWAAKDRDLIDAEYRDVTAPSRPPERSRGDAVGHAIHPRQI